VDAIAAAAPPPAPGGAGQPGQTLR
jgi:hypothetical protein